MFGRMGGGLGLGSAARGGGGGGGVPTTWNPADKSVNCSLDATFLIASGNGGFSPVRSTATAADGTWSGTIGAIDVALLGFANAAALLTNFIGQNEDGVGFYPPSGAVYINNAAVVTYSAVAVGHVVNCRVRRALNKVWFGADGVWFAGNGDDGTGGVDISSIAGDLFAACSPTGGTVTADFTGFPA